MESITLYRRAIRSGRIPFMNEVIVRLSTEPNTEFMIESLNNRISMLLSEDDCLTPMERMKIITTYKED